MISPNIYIAKPQIKAALPAKFSIYCNYKKILVLLLGPVFILIETIINEGKTQYSLFQIKKCSLAYWIVLSIYFAISIGHSALAYKITQKDNCNNGVNSCFPFKFSFFKLQIVAVITGFFGGLLGIGGGIFVSPILLKLGYDSEMCAATTMGIVILTTLSSLIQYCLTKDIIWEYSIFLCVFVLAGTVAVNFSIIKKIRKSRKSYAIIFCLFALYVVGIMLYISLCICISEDVSNNGRYFSDLIEGSSFCPD